MGATALLAPGTRCTAFDGSRTGIFAVDPGTHRLTPLASVTGRFSFRGESRGGWVLGWWDRAPVLLRATTREAIRIAGRDGDRPFQLAIADRMVGAVAWSEGGSTVRLYPLEDPKVGFATSNTVSRNAP